MTESPTTAGPGFKGKAYAFLAPFLAVTICAGFGLLISNPFVALIGGTGIATIAFFGLMWLARRAYHPDFSGDLVHRLQSIFDLMNSFRRPELNPFTLGGITGVLVVFAIFAAYVHNL